MVRPVCQSVSDWFSYSVRLSKSQDRGLRTRRKRLLELLGLVAVLEDKGVELAAAADLELDLLVGVLLHARSCRNVQSVKYSQLRLQFLRSKSFIHASVSEIRKTSVSI